jgi:PhzF family phenazine biosynthesis protein
MTMQLFQVDAFTSVPFRGNPAAVVPLEAFPTDGLLQEIAQENNLSETAYFVPTPDDSDADYRLRWFTPVHEMPLCGHATLASAHVLFEHLGFAGETIRFQSQSGVLRVRRAGNQYEMDFPALDLEQVPLSEPVASALGAQPAMMFTRRTKSSGSQYDLAVFENADQIASLTPNFDALARSGHGRLIVTAPGGENGLDFVSRFFAPEVGINEDPVTGSAHCILVPYWSDRLAKKAMTAKQVSARGGDLECELVGERVLLRGGAVTYLVGEFEGISDSPSG